MGVGLPSTWNRSRAVALGATLVLHLLAAAWLLALRFDLPPPAEVVRDWIWLPVLPAAPPKPRPEEQEEEKQEPPEPAVRPVAPARVPEPDTAISVTPTVEDWQKAARDVAGEIGGGPGRRSFAEPPGDFPENRWKDAPSIWKKPLPRVGTTVETPEGETILWVSDNCYVSLGSRSLTMGDFHNWRQGQRTCQVGIGKKKPRDDLLKPIKPRFRNP
jgi:hypothetical protein